MLKKLLIKIIKKNSFFLYLFSCIYSIPSRFIVLFGIRGNSFSSSGAFLKSCNIKFDGSGNELFIGKKTRLTNVSITFLGNNSVVYIDENCIFKNLHLCVEDDLGQIRIHKNTTIEGGHIAATEGQSIWIGSDSMFSYGIEIRNGDSHPIFDMTSNERINSGKDIVIGHHVWLGSFVKILKGSRIGNGTVIGTGSIISGEFEQNSIVAGIPGRVISKNIRWERDRNSC